MKVGLVSMLMLGAFCGFEIYHQTGMVHATKKNGFGCICHSFDPTPSVNVWIAGPDTVGAGTAAAYTVNVAKSGNIAAGFNVAGYFGSLALADSTGTKLERESSTDSLELTHTLPRFAAGSDTITWTFMYKAPFTAGTVDTLFSAGNAVNNDTLPDGDFWNYGENFLVHVTGPTSVDAEPLVDAYRLLQNYPNPFNPYTHIPFSVRGSGGSTSPTTRFVSLKVFDMLGREVVKLVNGELSAGSYAITFDARGLTSGIYFYRLQAGSFSQTKKMIVAK